MARKRACQVADQKSRPKSVDERIESLKVACILLVNSQLHTNKTILKLSSKLNKEIKKRKESIGPISGALL